MKKLMFALMLALVGAAANDAFAGGYYRTGRCYKRCESRCEVACPAVESCPKPACKVDRVVEAPCPAVPCCVRYVKVEEPALVTKHISYSVECPSGCTEEQKAAGMMKAGETINY